MLPGLNAWPQSIAPTEWISPFTTTWRFYLCSCTTMWTSRWTLLSRFPGWAFSRHSVCRESYEWNAEPMQEKPLAAALWGRMLVWSLLEQIHQGDDHGRKNILLPWKNKAHALTGRPSTPETRKCSIHPSQALDWLHSLFSMMWHSHLLAVCLFSCLVPRILWCLSPECHLQGLQTRVLDFPPYLYFQITSFLAKTAV